MRRRDRARTLAAAALLLALTLPATAWAAPVVPVDTPQASTHIVTGPTTAGYVVALRPGARITDALANETATIRPGRTFSAAIPGFTARLTARDAAALRANPAVATVEYDSLVYPAAAQAWPTWGLDRIDQPTRALNKTYAYTSRGKGVKAYIVDSGVRAHREFGSRLARGFSANGGSGRRDCAGHGTHVAGTVGGRKFGVAKSVRIIPVRVGGCGTAVRRSHLIAGLDYIVRNHSAGQPAVANVSLGGPKSAAVDRAVRGVLKEGVTVVSAAGNAGIDACDWSPARVSGVITVGAANHRNRAPDWSNGGPCVDIFAPGVGIKSAGIESRSDTEVASGTSMAAPHVAGAAARYLSVRRGASPAAVHRRLVSTARTGVVRDVDTGTTRRMLYVRGKVPTHLLSNNGDAAQEWGTQVGMGASLFNTATHKPIAGKTVTLYRRTPGSSTWSRVKSDTTNRYGQVRVYQRAENRMIYQLRHPGSATSKPSRAESFTIDVLPAQTKLSVSLSDNDVAPGEPVTIRATLRRVHDNKRLPGRVVELYPQNTAVPLTKKTNADGVATWVERPLTTTWYDLFHPQDNRTYPSQTYTQVRVSGTL